MLKALYDYGVRRQLVLPAGYVEKTVAAYICLSDNSAFAGIYLGDSEAVPCPDIGALANGKDKCNVLVEKRFVVMCEAPGKDKAPNTQKSGFFLDTLRAAALEEPLLNVCVNALESPEISARIREELDRVRIKPGDRISFRVNGKNVLDSEKIRVWWQNYRKQLHSTKEESTARCLITGEPTVPLTTTSPIQGLQIVGGHARGDALICFDKAAFCSYDQKQAANAPVSEEAFAAVKAALDDLLKDAPILAGMKFVHWFNREIPKEDDPLYSLDFGYGLPENDSDEETTVNEQTEQQSANKVPESVLSGQAVPSLDGVSYYILLLTGVSGRVMIRRYDRGNYDDLCRNLEQWYADLSLTNQQGGGTVRSVKLNARLLRLLKYQKADARPFDRLAKELAGITPAVIQAILTDGVLPDSVAAKALSYIRSDLLADEGDDTKTSTARLPNSLACQWLKVWLIRKNRMNRQEVPILDEYNMNLRNSAYHCGGLMAVFAAIQKEAMPDVNTGIVERYYASAIQMPALVIGQLSSRSNHHLKDIEKDKKWLAAIYREKLEEVSATLGNTVPATLNLEQQSYFALGYYQMGAMLNHEKAERIAAAKQNAEQADE